MTVLPMPSVFIEVQPQFRDFRAFQFALLLLSAVLLHSNRPLLPTVKFQCIKMKESISELIWFVLDFSRRSVLHQFRNTWSSILRAFLISRCCFYHEWPMITLHQALLNLFLCLETLRSSMGFWWVLLSLAIWCGIPHTARTGFSVSSSN